MLYRQSLQAFIDRWRYNANRGWCMYSRECSDLSLFENSSPSPSAYKGAGETARAGATGSRRHRKFQVSAYFSGLIYSSDVYDRFPEVDKISPPLLQLSGVNFGYTPEKQILKDVYIDVGLDSRIAVVGANGAGRIAHTRETLV